MPFFKHDGLRFHYRDEGAGLPFFFQHGLGGDVTQPFGLFKPPAGVRLIAFDARDHGQTETSADPAKLRFATFAEDLSALMGQLGIGRAVIGGISMGAALALHCGLRWPDRLQALVLSRPAWLTAPCPWNVKMFTLVAGLIRRHGAEQGLVMFQQTPEYRETQATWPDVAESLSLQFKNPRIEETVIKLECIIRDTPHPDRQAWSTVRVPTLVMGNRLDPVHPYDYAEQLASEIPGAEFREITSKSVSLEQHNADVQRCLEEFLNQHFLRSCQTG
jgi:pimeloyl-ACP methyl ester carboxylesterase